jgi:mono/diheme cytochrome c family protein
MGFALLIMAVLGALSYLHPATLGPIANPADTHFLPRPEWYYLPMFEWLKFWEGPKVVAGIVVIPGLLAIALFLMPFLDRRLERQPWRRPIPVLAVAVVVLGMVYLGIKSQIDDKQGPVAAQLALQVEQERAYSRAPFEPYVESTEGLVQVAAGPADPLIAQGKAIFNERGCSGCHGTQGVGTAAAPSLVGVTKKYEESQLVVLLRTLNPRMKAGRMPAVDLTPDDMMALLAFLRALGTPAANVPALRRVPLQLPSAQGRLAPSYAMKLAWSAGPPNSGPENLSDSTAQGQQVFLEHGCFVCHGPSGAGGRAPALSPLVAKLSDRELSEVLQKPNARMSAGGMPPVEASREEIALLTSYLRSLHAPQNGGIHVAKSVGAETVPVAERVAAPAIAPSSYPAQPAVPELPVNETSATAQSAGRVLFISQGCVGCHGPTARGTKVAPSLVGITSKYPGDKLVDLLHNPTTKMRDGGMPTVTLNGEQMDHLVAYLASSGATSAPAPGGQEPADLRAAAAQPAPVQADGYHRESVHHDTVRIPLSPLALRGRQLFHRDSCGSCHGEEGVNGTAAAPGLAGTASLLPESTLESLLRHHSVRMHSGGMPLPRFNAEEMKAIVAYIRGMTPTGDQSKLLASGRGTQKN